MIPLQTAYRILLSIIFASSFNLMLGQIEIYDSIYNKSANSDITLFNPSRQISPSRQTIGVNRIDTLCNYSKIYPLNVDSVIVESKLYKGTRISYNIYDELRQRALFKWHNGEIAISGQSISYPGMMQNDAGSIWISQRIGNLSVCIGALANKYGWYQGIKNQYGLTGSLYYQISPKLSFKIYGTYYFSSDPLMINGMYLPPSMLGYYDYTKFGGYLNYNVNNRFGIQMGGQIIKRTYSNSYEAEPIATPYIKVGKGKKKIGIGLPVGQILNGLFSR